MKLSVHTYTDGILKYEVDSRNVSFRDLANALRDPETSWVHINVVGGAVLIRVEAIHSIEMKTS